MYEEIAAITQPLCLAGTGCGDLANRPYHCCEKQYCDKAAKFARDGYGIELQPTGHEIPFMGLAGCTVPLHLRPICTIHACSITWAAKSMIGGDAGTNHYFALRQRILDAERLAGRRIA